MSSVRSLSSNSSSPGSYLVLADFFALCLWSETLNTISTIFFCEFYEVYGFFQIHLFDLFIYNFFEFYLFFLLVKFLIYLLIRFIVEYSTPVFFIALSLFYLK